MNMNKPNPLADSHFKELTAVWEENKELKDKLKTAERELDVLKTQSGMGTKWTGI